MAALADLQAVPGLLAYLMSSDPRLLLINAVAWLDPSILTDLPRHSRYIEFDYDAEDDLAVGLHVARECFPAVYGGAVQLQWHGADNHRIRRYLVDGISRDLVVPVHSLDELHYGPPVEFYGVDLSSTDTADAVPHLYDRLSPMFAPFGLNIDRDESRDIPNTAFLTAKVLVESLTIRSEPCYADVCNLLGWMFSMSGNTAIDYTMEAFWENGYDSAGWTPDEVEFINALNLEAAELRLSAERALTALEDDDPLRTAFIRNVKNVLKPIRRLQQKGKSTRGRSNPDPATFTRYAHWPERA